jgi:hypothetical protein
MIRLALSDGAAETSAPRYFTPGGTGIIPGNT